MGNKSSSASDEGFDETKDLEAANPTTLNEHFSCADANANRDPVLITWSGPDDLENPKNWQNGLKWRKHLRYLPFRLHLASLIVYDSPR